jgi:hypothetical protein
VLNKNKLKKTHPWQQLLFIFLKPTSASGPERKFHRVNACREALFCPHTFDDSSKKLEKITIATSNSFVKTQTVSESSKEVI